MDKPGQSQAAGSFCFAVAVLQLDGAVRVEAGTGQRAAGRAVGCEQPGGGVAAQTEAGQSVELARAAEVQRDVLARAGRWRPVEGGRQGVGRGRAVDVEGERARAQHRLLVVAQAVGPHMLGGVDLGIGLVGKDHAHGVQHAAAVVDLQVGNAVAAVRVAGRQRAVEAQAGGRFAGHRAIRRQLERGQRAVAAQQHDLGPGVARDELAVLVELELAVAGVEGLAVVVAQHEIAFAVDGGVEAVAALAQFTLLVDDVRLAGSHAVTTLAGDAVARGHQVLELQHRALVADGVEVGDVVADVGKAARESRETCEAGVNGFEHE